MSTRLAGLLLRTAQGNAGRVATKHNGRLSTWADFQRHVREFAAGLLKTGLKPGDRVALIAANSDRYLEVLFAVSWAGGVLQPVNLRLAPTEVQDQLSDSGARFLIYDEAGRRLAEASRTKTLEGEVYIGEARTPDRAVRYDDMKVSGSLAEPASRHDDDLAVLMYTGGTTGRAKGVMISHRNLIMSSVAGTSVLGDGSDEIVLHMMPLFHVAGVLTALRATMVGVVQLFLPRFDPLLWLETISRERVGRVAMAPAMLKMVLDHERFGDFDLSSLRRLSYGTAPMTEDVLEAALKRLPHVGLTQAYGLTECTSGAVFLTPKYHVLSGPNSGKLRSTGRVMPGAELRILDPNGQEVPSGQIGEICIRGDTVMSGYWNRPEESAAALAGGWLHTGDAGYVDDEGFLFVVDRLKDMIVSGGENVYSAEVENALSRHPDVLECSVIGIPHELWGEQVHAVVRLRDKATAAAPELIEHCRTLIAGYKCPKTIEVRSDPLPRSAVGKVLKTELRKPFWQDQTRSVH